MSFTRALVVSVFAALVAACSSGSIDAATDGDETGDPAVDGGDVTDTHVTPGTDSGKPSIDSGKPAIDSAAPPVDSTPPPVDVGVDSAPPDPCAGNVDGAYCGDSIGGPAGKVYHCAGNRTASIEDCADGCSHNPPGVPDTCAGVLACSNVQWWNSALTYGPYMSSGWWDTDLAVSTHTKVQLRHASRLDKHGVYGWGFMPEFTDQVTGKRFRFLHLQIAPSLQYANVDGTIYPAGFVVGLSGGDTADTGLGTYSTGAHLCVQTLDTYRNCFPTGKDACK